MRPATSPIERSRPLYAGAALVVVGLGLLWRSGHLPLPSFLVKYGGDALWALMVFLGMGFLSPRSSTGRIGLLALVFAGSIEFLQLYHAPWIDGLRATVPGRLILGSTFNAPDLLAYAVGIAVGIWAESICFKARPIGR